MMVSSPTPARALLRLAAKDLRLGAVYLWAIVPVYLGYGAALFVATRVYFLVNGLFAFGLVVGLALLDSKYRGDLLLLSLPVTRRTVVLARYLTAILLVALCALLCLCYAALLGKLIPGRRSMPTTLETFHGIAPYTVAAVFFVCAFFPLCYRLGPAKALWALAALVLALVLVSFGVHALAWRIGHGSFVGYSAVLAARDIADAVADARAGDGVPGAAVRVALWTAGLLAALSLSTVLSVRAYARREV